MRERVSFWAERLQLTPALKPILRKAFPVHHSFFLGEIVLFAFVTLALTGFYLSLTYEGSSRFVKAGEEVPAAYFSIQYIDSLPFGRVIRSAHHWSAHVMIAAALLHLLRVLLSGAYKRPRELNWVVGVLLLVLSVTAAFTGYALPSDAYAVAATNVAYGIAAAVPWVGRWAADTFFGGQYPSPHSLPRLLALHMVWLPLLVAGFTALHLFIMVRQKHTQPGYARDIAPGRILGVPFWPQQAALMTALFLLYLGVVVPLGGAFIAHPIEAYGPPSVATPEVKPDWYFLWLYGILELIPPSWHFHALATEFEPEFFGLSVGIAVFVLAVAVPFLDRAREPMHYCEQPLRHPSRTALTTAALAFFATAVAASFHAQLGISVVVFRLLLILVPAGTAAAAYLVLRRC